MMLGEKMRIHSVSIMQVNSRILVISVLLLFGFIKQYTLSYSVVIARTNRTKLYIERWMSFKNRHNSLTKLMCNFTIDYQTISVNLNV